MRKLLWALPILIAGCIPLVDDRQPTIVEIDNGEIGVRDLYYYDDSLVFKIAFRDNNSLDSVKVDVRPAGSEPRQINDFRYSDKFRVRGRRLERTFRIVVPKFSTIANYDLKVSVIDKYRNIREKTWNFQIKADSIPPTFQNLGLLLPRSQDSRADYVACRSQIVRVLGSVSDNLLLKKVGVIFSGTPNGVREEEIVRVLYNRSISLDTFFKSNLVVPARANDGDILTMTFFAYDTAIDNRASAPDPFSGNLRTQTFRILVSCDDRPPLINVLAVSPRFVADREVALVQEGIFSITAATASDERALRAVYVAFNRDNSDLVLVDSLLITDNSKLVDLASTRLRLSFTAPVTARVGDVFRVTLFALDTALNYSEFYTIKLNIVENQPPTIQVTDTYVNGERLLFSTNDSLPILVSAGSVIRFDGKVDDDYRLANVRANWAGTSVFTTNNPSTPFDLSSFQSSSTFVVPPTVGSFKLEILALDEKGLPALVVYYFRRI